RVAVAIAVRRTHEGRDDLEIPLGDVVGLAPQIREPEIDVELEQLDSRRALGHENSVETPSDGAARAMPAAPQGLALLLGGARLVPERCQSSVRPPKLAEGASASVQKVSAIRIGPARVPSRDSPDEAVELLLKRSYTACEIDCEGGFWMD